MISVHFSHPEYLLLLPIAWAFTWWVARRSFAELDRTRRRWILGMRLFLFTVLVLALAGMQSVRPVRNLCTIFVVDVSDSISPGQRNVVLEYIHQAAQAQRSSDAMALVAFGAEALLDHAPEDRQAIRKIISVPDSSRTNIAAGIQLAMASFPGDMGKQIVLFSDGNENDGNALDQAEFALSNNVRISVVSLERDTSFGEALLLGMNLPQRMHESTPFQVSVLAESTKEVDGALTLFRDDRPVEKRQVHLVEGKAVIAFNQSLTQSGLTHYHAVLDVPAGQDILPDNNIADGYVRVSGKPRVLVVEDTPGDGRELVRALQDSGLRVELGGPERIPGTLAECEQFESIVFANVPAWRMAPVQMTVIKSAIHDMGMGFAMLGGPMSFSAGGYYHTPIEEALPVTMEMKKHRQLPSVTLVIVIDISGSMSVMEDGVPKIQLAAEAAKAAVELLQPIDKVCVIGYATTTDYNYVVPMTRVDDKERIYKLIDKLSPGGGGIYGLPAQKEAQKAMRSADTQLKHILYCADASDVEAVTANEPALCVSLARQMAQHERTTLSTVGFGKRSDPNWKQLEDMARAGGGTSYVVERLSNLPQIFTRDLITVSRSPLVEKPFRAKAENTAHPITRGLPWDAAPPLLGYVCTSRQDSPLAQVLLSSSEQDPVLATWSYGLGRSLAFTSDASAHWGAGWLRWEGYAPFWSQALRWTLRKAESANFLTSLTESHGRATIVVEAVTAEGEYRNLLDLRAHIAHISTRGLDGPRATSQTVKLQQTASGRYEAEFDVHETGAYEVSVEERDGNEVKGLQYAGLVVPYSPEFQHVHPNKALLAQLAERGHGEVNPPPADVFGRLRFSSHLLRNLWVFLAVLLAILFIGDVAARRILLSPRELLILLGNALRKRLPARLRREEEEKAPAPPTVLTPLLDTKEKTRRTTAEPPTTTGTLRELRRKVKDTPIIATLTPATPAEAEKPTEPKQPQEAPQFTTSELLRKKRARKEGE